MSDTARRTSPLRQAQALAGAGLTDASMARLVDAVTHLQDSVDAAEKGGETSQAARARESLAFVKVLALGRTALGELESAVAAALATGESGGAVDAQAALGRAYLLVGEPAAAHEQFAQSLVGARDAKARDAQAQALIGLGRARVALGRYGEAEASLGEGLQLARSMCEFHATALALAGLGECARIQGDHTTAQQRFSEAAKLARGGPHPYPLGLALVGLGRIALDEGDPAEARACFEEAIGAARAGPLAYLMAPCLCGLAAVEDDAPTAESLLGEGVGAAQRWGEWPGEALAFEQLARLSRKQGDLKRAAARHRHALALRARIGDPAAIATSLEGLAVLFADGEDASVAVRLLAAADSLRVRHRCVRPLSAAGEHEWALQSARRMLGDERFDAEWSQGATMSTRSAISLASGATGETRGASAS